MSTPDPLPYADRWLAAWNARDVDAVLAGMADDVVFTSPTAARVLPGTGGVVRGKEAVRRYWTTALAAVPDLRFELLAVHAGVDTLVLAYRNQAGQEVDEVLRFRDGLVVEGHAAHRLR